jgi:hypothetical protein
MLTEAKNLIYGVRININPTASVSDKRKDSVKCINRHTQDGRYVNGTCTPVGRQPPVHLMATIFISTPQRQRGKFRYTILS